MIMDDKAPFAVHSLQKAQIFWKTIKTFILSRAYKDFEYMFWVKNASQLPLHKGYDHFIDLIDGKQPLYKLIDYISEKMLFIFWEYINKNLANKFIRPSKFFFAAFILFVPKFNRGLRLCIDYRSLNNLTIKNKYPLSLVDKSLGRFGQAKQFIKLDFINAYYQICIKKDNK